MMRSEVLPMKRNIDHRALLARINRELKAENKQMHRSRKDGRDFEKLGAYYITSEDAVTAHHLNLAEYGKKHGLLQLNETLESEEK
jgi:hypothetical protein